MASKKAAAKKEQAPPNGRTIKVEVISAANGWIVEEMQVDKANAKTFRSRVAQTHTELVSLVAGVEWKHQDEVRK